MYTEDIELVKVIISGAGDLVREFAAKRSGMNVELKGKNDLVTAADLEVEKLIIGELRKSRPDDLILAEESSQRSTMPPKRTWVIDPIDGTTNFAHGFPVYCVSIGLWDKGQAVVGAVLEVNRNELFLAARGMGATLNGEPISVTSAKDPAETLLATGFPYRNLDLLDEYLDLFRTFMHETLGVRRPGSACFDLCCVAAGRFDGFYEYGLEPWDVGAGSLIITEAGGIVTDWNGTQNWMFGQRIIAGNPDIHAYLLQRIKDHIPPEKRTI
ncbi:MAG: inositol monophosphatase [Balneolaceae bacterium]|nr:MAG: inositol monophosphatase [Balneolaceae bacterium]